MGNHLPVIFLKSTYGHYVLLTEMTAESMSYAIQSSTTWCLSHFSLPFILILSIIPQKQWRTRLSKIFGRLNHNTLSNAFIPMLIDFSTYPFRISFFHKEKYFEFIIIFQVGKQGYSNKLKTEKQSNIFRKAQNRIKTLDLKCSLLVNQLLSCFMK